MATNNPAEGLDYHHSLRCGVVVVVQKSSGRANEGILGFSLRFYLLENQPMTCEVSNWIV